MNGHVITHQNKFWVPVGISRIYMMRRFLKHVIVPGIQGIYEHRVILECIQSRGIHPGNLSKAGKDLCSLAGHWAFNALLALEVNKDLVYLLAQHKDDLDLGHKVLKSVTIFQPELPTVSPSQITSDEDNIAVWPALRWDVVDCSEKLKYEATQRAAKYGDLAAIEPSELSRVLPGRSGDFIMPGDPVVPVLEIAARSGRI